MLVDVSDYTVVAEARGHKILWFRRFGSYQGEWLMLSRDDNLYYLWRGWYGSCSGCDSLAASRLDSWRDDHQWTHDDPDVVDFIKDYEPFLEMEPHAALEIAKRDGNLFTVMPANFRESLDEDWRLDGMTYEGTGRQLALIIKAEHNELEALEILEIDNLETRREAIETYGATSWMFDTEATVIDTEGDNQLCCIERPGHETFCFLHLKDGSSDRRYILRVSPEHGTVHEARAASFGMTPEQFRPTVET